MWPLPFDPRLILAGLLLAASFGGGYKLHGYMYDAAARQVAEDALEQQRMNEKVNRRNTDVYIAKIKAAASAASARAERLRVLSTGGGEPAAACRELDVPAAQLLPGATRADLESLAERAQADGFDLAACQDYVRGMKQ